MANKSLIPKPVNPDWDSNTLLRELALTLNQLIDYLQQID